MSKILKGLKRIKIFPLTANTSAAYTPGTGITVPGAQSISLDLTFRSGRSTQTILYTRPDLTGTV